MRVLIAGDFCPSERVSQMIENSDYSTIFSDVSNLIKEYEVDYSIVNFECPIVLSNANPTSGFIMDNCAIITSQNKFFCRFKKSAHGLTVSNNVYIQGLLTMDAEI
jgi:hypothetical protein